MAPRLIPLLLALCAPLPLIAAETLPVTIDAGGHRSSSASYGQWAGGIGAICATGHASASYTGRSGWVGQLPEPATVQFAVPRVVVYRSAGTISLPMLRDGDEEDDAVASYAVQGAMMPAAVDVTPTAGDVRLGATAPYALPLRILPRTDGMDSNLTVDLAATDGSADLGPATRVLLTILADPREDGRRRPTIDTTPGLANLQDEAWVYEVAVDISGMILPHVLNDQTDLEFILLDAPATAQMTKTGKRTARISWTATNGAAEHHVMRILVRDRITGLGDVQDALIYTVARPSGGG